MSASFRCTFHAPFPVLRSGRLWLQLIVAWLGLLGCDAAPPSEPREPAAGSTAQLAEAPARAGSQLDAEAIRQRYREAVDRRDVAAARATLAELEQALPPGADSIVELARLSGAIGEMNRARWLLQQGVEQYPDRIDLVLGLAETSLRVGDAAGALRALERVSDGAKEYAYSRILFARAQVLLGDLDTALAVLEASESQFPDVVGFRLERIEILQVEKRFAPALELVRDKQREELPADMRRWLSLREMELVGALEGPEAALEPLTRLLEAEPTSVELLQRQLALLQAVGRSEEALVSIEAALAIDPDSSGLYTLLAQVRMSTGDAEGAEQALRDDVAHGATAVSLTNLANFLHHAGRTGEGADTLARLAEVPESGAAIEPRYLQIAMLIEADRIEEAERGLAVFRRDYPKDPRVDYLLARLDLKAGNPEAAVTKLSDAVSRLDRSDLKHLLGVALELSGDVEGAEQRYGLAATQNPQQIPSWLGLLRTLEAQGKWREVIEVAGDLIDVAPASRNAYAALARAHLALGEPERAEEVLRDYALRFPDLSGPRMALAFALRRQGRLEEALASLDQADEEFPGDPALAAERAVLLGQLGRIDAGLELVAAALDDGEETAELRHARLYLLLASGRRTEALQEAERISRLDSFDSRAYRMAADYLSSVGAFAEAASYYERALGRGSVEPGIAFRLGMALDRAGQTDAAIAAYRRAIERDEDAVWPRNNLALALQRQGRIPEALEAAQGAYALGESEPLVMDTLGYLYLEAGRGDRAVALLEKASAADPSSPEIAYHLALAQLETGREEAARKSLAELSQRLAPEHELQRAVGKALASLP